MLKTHETFVAIIDYIAAHGFCLTEPMRYKPEQVYVRWRLDKHLMAFELTVAAFTWDNCDFSADHEYYGGRRTCERHIGHLRGCGISRRPCVAHA